MGRWQWPGIDFPAKLIGLKIRPAVRSHERPIQEGDRLTAALAETVRLYSVLQHHRKCRRLPALSGQLPLAGRQRERMQQNATSSALDFSILAVIPERLKKDFALRTQ
jgi:hypothetical protein